MRSMKRLVSCFRGAVDERIAKGPGDAVATRLRRSLL